METMYEMSDREGYVNPDLAQWQYSPCPGDVETLSSRAGLGDEEQGPRSTTSIAFLITRLLVWSCINYALSNIWWSIYEKSKCKSEIRVKTLPMMANLVGPQREGPCEYRHGE
jgi:hypothetical protein